MKPILLLLILVAAACGQKHSTVDYGKTTKAALIAEKGEPLEEKKLEIKDSSMLIYPDNEKYQVTNDIVTYGLKEPQGDQSKLIYWKHRFKDCDAVESKISKFEGHEFPRYQLKCLKEGVSVIYTPGSDSVSRIIEHEKE